MPRAYRLAPERYAALGVDADHALKALAKIPVSLHCWQGDDLGLDYFDASINRIAAWVIGARNLLLALLLALLEPPAIRAAELAGDLTARLALQEESKSLPFGSVWDYYCESKGVPVGEAWLAEVRKYEADVLMNRR